MKQEVGVSSIKDKGRTRWRKGGGGGGGGGEEEKEEE